MKTVYRIFEIKDVEVLTYASLSSEGLSSDEVYTTLRIEQGLDFETKLEAIERLQEMTGKGVYEICEIYIK